MIQTQKDPVYEYDVGKQESKNQISHVETHLLRLDVSSYDEAYESALELMKEFAEGGFSDDCIWIGTMNVDASGEVSGEVGEAFRSAYQDLHDYYTLVDEEPPNRPGEYVWSGTRESLREDTAYFRFLEQMPRDDEWRTAGEIAKVTDDNKQTVYTNIGSLNERGAVETRDRGDGSNYEHRMTDYGREALGN